MKHLKCKGYLPTRTHLATALMLVIGGAGAAFAGDASLPVLQGAVKWDTRASAGHSPLPAAPPVTYEVTSCADDGSPGTLRYVIDHAATGDTADLSNLVCSTITLANGQIVVPYHDFTISGEQSTTIDAHHQSRVIFHEGTGKLVLGDVNAVNGYSKYNSANAIEKGGCIFSNGYIHLLSSSVSNCGIANINGQAEGGGLYSGSGMRVENSTIANNRATGKQALGGGALISGSAYFISSAISGNSAGAVNGATGAVVSGGGLFTGGQARLNSVTVTNNQASATDGTATGGGITAGEGVYLSFTAVSNNVAVAPVSSGGGVAAFHDSFVYYSTIDHNQAANNAGAEFRTAGTLRIGNSTISSNTATTGSSALFSSIPTFINNSTIAFNTAHGSDAGLYFYAGGTLDIESTIVSNNTSSSGTSYDLVSHSSVNGTHNLIMHSPLGTVPGDTLTGIDPLLEPLAHNASFNPPMTHALAPTSPAIDRGSNPKNFNQDERWQPFARVIGITADIGAYEYDGTDTDTIFKNGFD